jgi:hypothetical protein
MGMTIRTESRIVSAFDGRWKRDRDVLTIRAPRAVELGFRSLTLTSGDLSRVFLFACDRVDPSSLTYVNTMSKKHRDIAARPKMGKAFLVKVGVVVRDRLSKVAKDSKVPVNCVAVGILSAFLGLIQRHPDVKRELVAELRGRRGL